MKKRHFPRNFKLPRMNNVGQSRPWNYFRYTKSENKCKNLRQEFDIIMRKKCKLITDDQLDHLWQIVGTQLLEAPQKSLEELLDTLDIE